MPKDPNQTNTLRIGIRELNALLNRIEENQTDKTDPDREFVRWQFRIVKAELTIEHAAGSKVVLPVATRNISRGGISVLHSSFVYPNSKCHITAILEDGRKLDMDGVVKRCNHIGGKVHELGIKFDEEVSTKELLKLDPMQEAYSLESIDPAGLNGNVLIIATAELDQQILIKLLEATSLVISVADNSETALKRAKKGCELILTDYQVGEETASEILMTLRAEGIDAPVLVMTSESSDEARDEMRMSGASGIVSKPFTQHKLLRAMGEFLVGDNQSGPIYTTLTEADPAYEILGKFLSELSRMILTLERSLRESDYESCLSITRSLASSATPLGYEPIGLIAAQADRALSRGSGVRDAAADVRRLIIACRQIKAKPKAAA